MELTVGFRTADYKGSKSSDASRMSSFRDPEWQLHIPQKEDTTIVLTHLYCISTSRGPLRDRRELWPPARCFPLLK
jgi:hypothetical protein